MAAFITDDNGDWEFHFEEPPKATELPEDPTMGVSYLAGPDRWKNYSDNYLYETEVLLRKFLESKKDDEHWQKTTSSSFKKFTCGMMFEILYGKKYDQTDKHEAMIVRRMPKLMAYYSTRIQKEGIIFGKRMTKSVYSLSYKRYEKLPPYSLRLRIEWLAERGEIPTYKNMKPPKDNLTAGHARKPRTEKNMARRRERAREIYNERYKDRAH